MADFPAMPLWTDAYIADTAHLTNEEHGVYLRLLMFAWRSADCTLPDNDKRLAIMVGVSAFKWATLRKTISQFFIIENGKWTQKRLKKTREYLEERSENNRAAANARWSAKSLKGNDTGDATEYAEAMPKPCQNDASLSIPIRSKKERDKSLSPSKDRFEDFWAVVPRKVAKGAALKAYRTALKSTDEETLIANMAAYAVSRKGQDPQFTVHPATWLNAGRWADEPAKPVAPVNDWSNPRYGDERTLPDGRFQVFHGGGTGWTTIVRATG